MRFRGKVLLNGKTATGIEVPGEIIAGLGSGKRPAVRATLNGFSYRTTLGTVDGKPMLPVSADVRQGAGVSAGDEVDVDLELDTEPREVAVPDELARALEPYPDARQFFDGLSNSNKRRIVSTIEEAKTEETRQRRVEKAVSMLREGRV